MSTGMRPMRGGMLALSLVIAASARSLLPQPAGAVPGAPTGGPGLWSDFNGDGHGDLAIGVPFEDVGDVVDAGHVAVLYGDEGGLSGDDDVWTEQSQGINGVSEPADGFGSSLSAGDFNGDGFDDLAVGVPFEHLPQPLTDQAGQIHVIYGSPAGLTSAGNQVLDQDKPGMPNRGDAGDLFGQALAAGDVTGDGIDDLVVGVPGEDVKQLPDGGAIHLLRGSAGGLTTTNGQFINQDTPGFDGVAAAGDGLGSVLASGDIDGDGFSDVAVTAPGEDVDGSTDVGAVNLMYGTARGLSPAGDQVWSQDSPGIPETAESGDLFGAALAVGDLDGDGFGDLAVGAQGDDIGAPGDPGYVEDAGAVNVLLGSDGGLVSSDSQLWTQDSPNVLGVAEPDDGFGSSLAAGDFDGDGFVDLTVGAEGEAVGTDAGSGSASTLYGSGGGLTATGNQYWTQDNANLADSAEPFDAFGGSLAAGDFDGDGRIDLAMGVDGEDLPPPDAGALHELSGSAGGLQSAGSAFWHQDVPGVQNGAEAGDRFGSSLSAG